jgi:hypothetical protein
MGLFRLDYFKTEAKLGKFVKEVALSDTDTAITTTGTVITFRLPACELHDVRISCDTASSSGVLTVDINADGTTILSIKLTLDVGETTSTTAATSYAFVDGLKQRIADDSEITVDIDIPGTDVTNLVLQLIGIWL